MDPLAPLLADGVIDEVVARLKSGKEAELWLVRQRGEVVAAKVYKAREARSFRNNAAYKEGRRVRDTRTQRAMDRGSRFGQAAAEEAWKSREADALHALHAAGVRVPAPVLFYEGVLLMEVVVDAHGHPAPRLVDAKVAPGDAAALYADVRRQVVRMLTCDLIHGDLSPYNILAGAHGPVIIDFPQAIGAAHNSQARRFFERDLENVRRFFAALDPALGAASGDASEIWRAYERRELHPDFVPSGRPAERPRPQPQNARPPGAPHRPPRAQPSPARHVHHRDQRPAREPAAPQRQRAGSPAGRHRQAPAPEVVRVSRGHPGRAAATAGPPAPQHGPPSAHGAAPHGGPSAHRAAAAALPQQGRRRRRRRR